MLICIYCLAAKPETDFNIEHVIPKSFGTFGNKTPTLINTVCKDCNDYFCKELDPIISRDTYEGITRYPLGMKSREARPQTKIRISIPDKEEMGSFRGARIWINGTTGGIELYNQVGFVEKENGKRVFFTEDELDGLVLSERGLSDEDMSVIARSQQEHDDFIAKLISKKIIKKFEQKGIFDGEPLSKPIHPFLEGTVDDLVKRALAKIGFNFAAKFIGKNEVLKGRWHPTREYIRNGTGLLTMRMQSGKPFWDNEGRNWRFGKLKNPNAIYNIRVENQKIGIVVVMEFFHLFIYEIVLVHGVSLDPSQEVGRAFIPGEEPLLAIKLPFNPYGGIGFM